jgi:hypothetical protein
MKTKFELERERQDSFYSKLLAIIFLVTILGSVIIIAMIGDQ